MRHSTISILIILIVALPATAIAAPPRQGEDYVVQADDWLGKLADKFLGDVLAYQAITYYTNQKNAQDSSYVKITDSNIIDVGQKIYIPTGAEVQAYFEGQAETLGEGTLKIGALAPLSAPGSVSAGTAMKTAFEIALEEINAAGGVLGQPVTVILLDTEGLAERGTTAMERLIEREGVVGVVGEYHSPVGLEAKEVAVSNNVPVVFAETWNDNITADRPLQIFHMGPLASEVAAIDANFIESLEAEFVVIVTENSGYGGPAAALAAERLTERDIESETFSADVGTVDFGSLIEGIEAGRKPDVILVLLLGETSFNFQQQAAAAGLGPQEVTMICNQAAADSEAFWAAVPDGNLCLFLRLGLPAQLWSEQTEAFAAKYTERTGKAEPEIFAMEAYDSLKVMAQAIEEAGTTEPEAIIAALESISYDGALGTITFPYGIENPIPADVAAKWWHQFPDPPVTIVQYQEPGQDAAAATVVFPETYQTGEPILPPGSSN